MNRSTKWQRNALIVLCSLLALVLTVMAFGTAYVHYLLSLINRPVPPDTDGTLGTLPTYPVDPNYTGPTDMTLDTLPPESQPSSNREAIVNILLVGQDRRPGEDRQRSDSMILCTFNKQTKAITMTSFMRDTYVYIPGSGNNKLNAAYQIGGFTLLNKTLATNFGVHVDGNVEVDFNGFEKIIDLLGGVDIQLTADEAKNINGHLGREEVSEGWQTLNGEQALWYARNRSTSTLTGAAWDFGRTERQRRVIAAIFTAYKNKSLSEMLGLMDDILPLITTNLSNSEILSYVGSLFPMLAQSEINTLRIPLDGTYESMDQVGRIPDVLVPDLDPNRDKLWEIMNAE